MKEEKQNKIELILNDSGDWEVLKLNDEIFAEGHSITRHEWIELLKKMHPTDIIKVTEISDKEMENGNY